MEKYSFSLCCSRLKSYWSLMARHIQLWVGRFLTNCLQMTVRYISCYDTQKNSCACIQNIPVGIAKRSGKMVFENLILCLHYVPSKVHVLFRHDAIPVVNILKSTKYLVISHLTSQCPRTRFDKIGLSTLPWNPLVPCWHSQIVNSARVFQDCHKLVVLVVFGAVVLKLTHCMSLHSFLTNLFLANWSVSSIKPEILFVM